MLPSALLRYVRSLLLCVLVTEPFLLFLQCVGFGLVAGTVVFFADLYFLVRTDLVPPTYGQKEKKKRKGKDVKEKDVIEKDVKEKDVKEKKE